ncbi:MAG: YdiU family protein [Rubrivivax sp.]|nr:YdiU family protein [Rubrivivax sp.]
MNVGFIHGVMNTDNMAISGETIDYGPCAFMEATTRPRCSAASTMRPLRLRQPATSRAGTWRGWVEALLPLVADGDDEAAAARRRTRHRVTDAFPALLRAALLAGQRAAFLGLRSPGDEAADTALCRRLAGAAAPATRWIFTLAWRRLADAAAGDEAPLRALFAEPAALDDWLARWRERCAADDAAAGGAAAERAARMRRASPFVIPRNHRVEEALAAAQDEDDLGPFEQLLAALRQPFDETPALARYGEAAPAAVTACYQTFCGT